MRGDMAPYQSPVAALAQPSCRGQVANKTARELSNKVSNIALAQVLCRLKSLPNLAAKMRSRPPRERQHFQWLRS